VTTTSSSGSGSGRLYWEQGEATATESSVAATHKPSFWQRIGIDRGRSSSADEATPVEARGDGTFPNPIRALEQRLVAPMLESLAGVEAKLERSHRDVLERCDVLENDLAGLIDETAREARSATPPDPIEEIRRVERRLEDSIQTQTRTLRLLIGIVFFAFGAGASAVLLFLSANAS